MNLSTCCPINIKIPSKTKKQNSAVCVRTRTVNVNTFSTTVKDEILEGQQIQAQARQRGLLTTPIILCVVGSVSRSYVILSVSRSYVTRLFKVDTDFKNSKNQIHICLSGSQTQGPLAHHSITLPCRPPVTFIEVGLSIPTLLVCCQFF